MSSFSLEAWEKRSFPPLLFPHALSVCILHLRVCPSSACSVTLSTCKQRRKVGGFSKCNAVILVFLNKSVFGFTWYSSRTSGQMQLGTWQHKVLRSDSPANPRAAAARWCSRGAARGWPSPRRSSRLRSAAPLPRQLGRFGSERAAPRRAPVLPGRTEPTRPLVRAFATEYAGVALRGARPALAFSRGRPSPPHRCPRELLSPGCSLGGLCASVVRR